MERIDCLVIASSRGFVRAPGPVKACKIQISFRDPETLNPPHRGASSNMLSVCLVGGFVFSLMRCFLNNY